MRTTNLVGVCKTSHTTHDAEDIVVSGIDTNLGGLGSRDGSSRDNKLKSCVVNSGEIASSRWLVLLGAKCEGEDIDTSVGMSSVMLERLDEIEVSSFALREAVLSVKLELSGNNRVLTPAVHLAGSLSEDESTGIRDTIDHASSEGVGKVGIIVGTRYGGIISGWVSEKTGSINDRCISGSRPTNSTVKLLGASESAD